ncbi:hypothetical protein [Mucilaginibacter gotjawali]|uniref:Uncharacterized protein n=2 Tax=Mucilaginibacter gotjawali TaxID=1550579 RepID=A0A839SPJ9_9SPHI|nr:hypothetical protein [Mucilaginibacter gotjawali]MBB3058307.1 hypothetical protein [Mucilaginibacter gotjawali]BAU55574.1 hypothetical protein MgSA37_03764 [Mucilaginibacter gotjawali]
MKTGVFFAVFSILSLSIFLVWSRFEDFNHNISITVSEETDTYEFSARYDRLNTRQVQAYINECIKPNQMGNSENDYVDATTTLPDNTRFYIKESPGRVKIRLDKTQNSPASCFRIKKMCEGLKQLLAGK